MRSSNFVTISEFAKMCHSTIRTIRYYDLIGLLSPFKTDKYTNYRYYHPVQVKDFLRIKLLQTFEIPLHKMKRVLKKSSKQEFIEQELQNLESEIIEKQKRYQFLKTINTFLFDPKGIDNYVTVEQIPEQTILGIETKEGRYENQQGFETLQTLASDLKIPTTGDKLLIYLDPQNYQPKSSHLKFALICQKLPQTLCLPEGFFIEKIPPQKAIIYNYHGPFEFLAFIHPRLIYSDFFKKHKLAKFCYDLYPSTNSATNSVYDLKTKIVYPILQNI